jgi:hypothetical protein
MRVNVREDERISAQRHGRDALPRDPAWHVSKLVFGFSHGRSRLYSGHGVCSRLWACHAGSRGSAPLPWGPDLIPYVDADGRPPMRGYKVCAPKGQKGLAQGFNPGHFVKRFNSHFSNEKRKYKDFLFKSIDKFFVKGKNEILGSNRASPMNSRASNLLNLPEVTCCAPAVPEGSSRIRIICYR